MYKTAEDILRQVHRIYEGDIDYLEFADEETQLHFALLKDGIEEWINRFPEYREVFTDLASASDGDKITTTATVYNCPANFVRPANVVKIGSKYLDYIPPEKVALKLQENSGSEWFTITGSPGAYKLRINPAPSAGSTIDYDYWKTVTVPTLATSVIEVSRPFFVTSYILNKLFAEDDPGRAKEYDLKMDEEERLERVALAKSPSEPNQLKVNGAGFNDTGSSVSDIVSGQ